MSADWGFHSAVKEDPAAAAPEADSQWCLHQGMEFQLVWLLLYSTVLEALLMGTVDRVHDDDD